MAFTELEIAQHQKALEDTFWSRRRPPLDVREQMREGQRFTDQAIELFFVRPAFNRPVAKKYAKRPARRQNRWPKPSALSTRTPTAASSADFFWPCAPTSPKNDWPSSKPSMVTAQPISRAGEGRWIALSLRSGDDTTLR
jgi:hypothetical protein